MSWKTIEQRQSTAPREWLPASVSFLDRGRPGHLANCIVALNKPFVAEIGWARGFRVGVQIGTDNDAGKLRLIRGGVPPISKALDNKNGLRFDLGVVPDLGTAKRANRRTAARVVDADTVEIDLPERPPDQGSGGVTRRQAPAPVKRRGRPPGAKTRAAPARQDRPVTARHGVVVDQTTDDEHITCGDKMTDLTANQATTAARLLAAAPNPIGHEFLRAKVLGAGAANAEERMGVILGDLIAAARSIGLEIVDHAGVGVQMKVGG